MYCNARSVLANFDELSVLCNMFNYHIVCIVESWLCDSILNSEFFLPGYTIFRRDRDRHGGGVLIFVKVELCASLIPLPLTSMVNLEFLPISFTFHYSKFCIALFYRPPSSDVNYFDNFCSVVESLNIVNYSNFILVGDFNIDYYNTTHYLYSRLKCLWELLSLKQIVTEPTHSSPNGNQSLIDLVFLSNAHQLMCCKNLPPLGNSDHACIDVHLSTKKDSREITQPSADRVVWKYAQADFDRANELLSNEDADVCSEENDIELAWSKWEKYFMDVMRECIPTVTVKVNRNPPWLTHDLLLAIRSRNSLYRRARKTGSEAHLDCYKKKRNEVANMLKSAKFKFFELLDPSNPKVFWKTTNT